MENKISSNVSLSNVNALGCGHVSIFFMRNGIWILATPFFQMTLGLDPFLLSLSITLPLFFSLLIGPFVGELSDLMYERHGTRNPLLVISATVCGLTYGMLWLVPMDWSQQSILIYIFILSFFFQVFANIYIIPLTSAMFEVSDNSYQRTRTLAYVAYYNKVCSVLYHWAFPLAQLSLFSSVLVGIKIVGCLIGFILISLFGFAPIFLLKDNKRNIKHTKADYKGIKLTNIHGSLRSVLSNKNFCFLMLAVISQTCVSGYSASMDYYLIVYYMFDGNVVEGAFWKGVLSSSYSFIGFLAIPFITLTAKKIGTKKALERVFILTIVGGIMKWFIFVPGNEWLLPLDAVFSSSIWLSMFVLVPSIIADLSQESSNETNQDRKGSFIYMHTLSVKLSSAVAVILSGLTLNWIGFDAALSGEQTSEALLFMRIILTLGTVFSSVIGFFIVRKIKN